MQKLMKAVYNEYQVVPNPKQIEKVTLEQQVIILKRRKLKYYCRTIGVSLFGSGMTLWYYSKIEQEKYQCPWWNIKESPPILIQSGPYKYSRNPMYLGYITMYFSLGIFFLNWIFISIPCFGVAYIAFKFYDDTYIPIEEDKLMRKFGEKYMIYCAMTPRWIGFPRKITPQNGEMDINHYSV